MTERFSSLPAALDAERTEWRSDAGLLSYYAAGRGRPLLLIHSINAAASAYEVRPIFEHYRHSRHVVAVDLPGFGFAERSKRRYDMDLYTRAVRAMVLRIADQTGQPVDALALSLSCEFLARAASDGPARDAISRVALVTPTGFRRGDDERRAAPGHSREIGWLSGLLKIGLVGPPLFKLLTRPGVIRYFLKRTWGSDSFDEGLAQYDIKSARQPGAEHAPLAFVSGRLFSRNPAALYQALSQPVWLAHGTRGDFRDFRGADWVATRANWTRLAFKTGAFPHFEAPKRFFAALDQFLDASGT